MQITLREALNTGRQLRHDQKLADAQLLYQQLVSQMPNNFELNFEIGSFLLEQFKHSESLKHFAVCLGRRPNHKSLFNLTYEIAIFSEESNLKTAILNQAKSGRISLENEKRVVHEKIPLVEERKFRSLLEANYFDEAFDVLSTFPKPNVCEYDFYLTKAKMLLKQGEFAEARRLLVTCIDLDPQKSAAFYLLGESSRVEHDWITAIRFFKKTIIRDPTSVNVWKKLAVCCMFSRNFEFAVFCCQKILSRAPLDPEAAFNKGSALVELGALDKAQEVCASLIRSNPKNSLGYDLTARIIPSLRLSDITPEFSEALISTIKSKSTSTRPRDFCSILIKVLKAKPRFQNLLLQRIFSMSDLEDTLKKIQGFEELLVLMQYCAIPDLSIEQLLTDIRRALLIYYEETKLLPYRNFIANLGCYCYLTEFIFATDDDEEILLGNLIETSQRCKNSRSLDIKLLIVSCYRPLTEFPGFNPRIFRENQLTSDKLVKIQWEEPLEEKRIRGEIPTIGKIEDQVSLAVRNQYEENPYPRWIKTINNVIKEDRFVSLVRNQVQISKTSSIPWEKPNVLIAGCGTGEHAIIVANKYLTANVTAIDLSLASLTYARRKIEEANLDVECFQCDILQVEKLNRTFDWIESVGVLHHMSDPFSGLSQLANVLNRGGIMKLGLYSQYARQHVSKIRTNLSSHQLSTNHELRQFRKAMIDSTVLAEEYSDLITWSDFYSLSEFRDLICHVEEHQFTIPAIKDGLLASNLRFCGFEQDALRQLFFQAFGLNADLMDLNLWDSLEQERPKLFSGMYQFWVQKL